MKLRYGSGYDGGIGSAIGAGEAESMTTSVRGVSRSAATAAAQVVLIEGHREGYDMAVSVTQSENASRLQGGSSPEDRCIVG